MNSNGSDFLTVLLLLAAAAVGIYMMAIFAFFALIFILGVSAFIAFAWTFICLLALFHPFQLGNLYLESWQAQYFLLRGVYGAIIVPTFLMFLDVFLDVDISWDYLALYATFGYTLLSVGIEYLFFKEADLPYVYYDIEPDVPRLPPSRQRQQSLPSGKKQEQELLPPPKRKKKYASWDDEEEFR